MTEETRAAIERLAPMCEEFGAAIRLDVGYALDLARDAGKVERGRAAALLRHSRRRERAA